MKNKLLILGSVVSPCPPLFHGGTERVAYSQAKELAKRGLKIIFVGAKGTINNFTNQLKFEKENLEILKNIEFFEIGGGTGFGDQKDSLKINPQITEASRKLRLELVNISLVQKLMIEKKDEYDLILNNLRGEAILLPLAVLLGKKIINVMHLNLFPELADIFKHYKAYLIPISNSQKELFPNLNYLPTIYNPINTKIFPFNPKPKDYALMISTIGYHKNQLDAILAAKKAGIKLIIAGKIRDNNYFHNHIRPHIDGKNIVYYDELNFEEKIKLYQDAKVFLFPIKWQEPFGLVVIEALACGTPVIAYPHGGPKEIIIHGKNGYLVSSIDQMTQAIKNIEKIDRSFCRQDVVNRFDEKIIGEKYFNVLNFFFKKRN